MRGARRVIAFTGPFVLVLVAGGRLGWPVKAQPNAPAGEPLVASASRQIGVRRCLAAIDSVSRRVTQGATRQDIMMDWDRARPDVGPLFALTGMSDGRRKALFTLAAAPTPEGGCSLMAERIGVEKVTCQNFAATELSGYQSSALIDGISVYYSRARPGETFTLTNAGTNCLVVRRQPAFNTRGTAR